MNVLKGQVEKYFVDGPRMNKKGKPYFIHSLYIGGEKYGNIVDSANPKAEINDMVEFTWEQNGMYRNFDPKTIKIVERGTPPVQNARPASVASATSRDASIGRQNALRHATAIVTTYGKYKSPEEAAMKAVELCDGILYPYIENGATAASQEVSAPSEKQDAEPEIPFNDDLPF